MTPIRTLKKRNSSFPLLDKITPSIVINLYANYFTFNNKTFIENLNEHTIPSSLLDVLDKQKCKFYNGNIAVEVRNHCLNDQTELTSAEITRIWLHMTPENLWMDLCLLNERFGHPQWTQDASLEIESKILTSIEKDLCLEPKIEVSKIKNLINYNDCKHNIKKKKRKDKTNEDEEAEKKAQQQQLLLLFSNNKNKKESRSRFNRINFIEEWRKKKVMADSEPLICISSSNKKPNTKVSPTSRTLLHNLNRVVRTLRFENTTRGIKTYTVLNIYELSNGENEAVLRWGTIPNTSINGGLLKYPIGNNAAAEYYIANFIYFYSLTNKLVSDDIDKDKENSYSVIYQPDPTNENGIHSIPTSMLSTIQVKSSINLNSPQTLYSNISSVSNSSSYQYSPHVAKKAKTQSNSKLNSSKSGQTVAPLPNAVNPITFSPVNNPVQTPPNPATSLQQKLQQSQLQKTPLQQTPLQPTQLQSTPLQPTQLQQTQLQLTQLQPTQLQQAQLQQVQLQQAQLQQAQLQQAQLQPTQLQPTQLQQTQLQQTQLLQKNQLQQVQLQQQIQQSQLHLAQLQKPQPHLNQSQVIQLQFQLTHQIQLQKVQLKKLQESEQQQILQQRYQQLQKENAAQTVKTAMEAKAQVPVQGTQTIQNAQVQQLQLQNQSTPPLKATPTIQNKSLSTSATAQVKTNITPSIPTKPINASTTTISTPQITQQSPVNKVTQKIPTAATTVANGIAVTQSTPLMKTPSLPAQPITQQQTQQTTPLLSSQNRVKTTPNIPYKSSPPLNLHQPNTATATAAMNKYYPEGFNANAAAAQAKIISGSPPSMVNNQLKMANMGFMQHQNAGIPTSLLTHQQQLLIQQQLALQQQQNAVPIQLLQGTRGIPQQYAEASLEAYNLQTQKTALEQVRRQQYAAASGIPYPTMTFPPQLNNPNLMGAHTNVQQIYQQLTQSRQAALQHQMDLKNKKK
ncbi:hypothetical protein BCR36DRAFT_412355 [Piromyces finnis]|uniref:Spt20-like SEP domain-containing protein n=1 Tax=Piromyces finnis TaxID=1754191 RepID=A0A1Y1V9J0_9FUNG|nr:hypothetical protein BCR36DRAFT_412355 [Piromyces finnis]|eukprot:ORX50332.1 hypothetical protein BCR36DRAFT_412355 [Piromyces finnis]